MAKEKPVIPGFKTTRPSPLKGPRPAQIPPIRGIRPIPENKMTGKTK